MQFNYGDIIHDEDGTEFHVTGLDPTVVVWISHDGTPKGVSYDSDWDPTEFDWCVKVTRKGETVWSRPPEFKFGDKVVNKITPDSKAFFIKYRENDTYCDVAYRDSNSEAIVQQTLVQDISHAT